MQYERHAFSGNEMEKAYLVGLRAGDVNAWQKTRNTIEARVSTTHPAMANLFSNSFKPYGHIMADAGKAYLPGRYRWQIRAHLDSSFRFLVSKASSPPKRRVFFYRFLSGYSDAECCWCVYFSESRLRASWSIESKDLFLLENIKERLLKEGFHPLYYYHKKPGKTGLQKNQKPKTPRGEVKGRLELQRMGEVVALAKRLLPLSRHAEKTSKMRLILKMSGMTSREILTELRRQRGKISAEVASFEEKAEREYKKGKRQPRNPEGSSASLV